MCVTDFFNFDFYFISGPPNKFVTLLSYTVESIQNEE